ncbi:MAG: ribonucleoside-diphosphate reductase, adenosylcobalamin-dependent, partial [Acidilobaceae archaeon]|nr:ribonucleoside-diphosphate reductase, adenosylcobalamin-dependent [Acidilobaceae archaeon]
AFMKALMEDDMWWMVNPKYSDEGDGIYRIHYSFSTAYGKGIFDKWARDLPWLINNPYFNIYEDVAGRAIKKALEDMERVSKASGWALSPDYKNSYAWRMKARDLWNEIVRTAWEGGDPGVIYFDNHNKWNPTPWLGMLNATNPCSEQVLYPFENCNLGSVNLAKYIKDGKFDIEKLANDMKVIVDAMDATIDINRHPDERHYKVNY